MFWPHEYVNERQRVEFNANNISHHDITKHTNLRDHTHTWINQSNMVVHLLPYPPPIINYCTGTGTDLTSNHLEDYDRSNSSSYNR